MTETIPEAVKRLLRWNLGYDETKVTDTARLVEDLGMDSLDLIETTIALEQEFDVQFSDAEAEAIRTVQQIIAAVEAKRRDAAGHTAGESA